VISLFVTGAGTIYFRGKHEIALAMLTVLLRLLQRALVTLEAAADPAQANAEDAAGKKIIQMKNFFFFQFLLFCILFQKKNLFFFFGLFFHKLFSQIKTVSIFFSISISIYHLFSGVQADAQIAGAAQGPAPPVNPRAGRARTPPHRLQAQHAHVPDRQRHMRHQLDFDEVHHVPRMCAVLLL
jgi:hypothetical protein